MCVGLLSLYTTCPWCQRRSEESLGPPGTVGTDCCQPLWLWTAFVNWDVFNLFFMFLFLIIFIDYMESHIVCPYSAYLPCLAPLPVTFPFLPKKTKSKSILCCPSVYLSVVTFLVASPPREAEPFSACIHIHARSHPLRRAMLCLEQGETSSPRSPPQPAPQCPCRRLVRVGTSSPVPLDINMTSSGSPEHGHSQELQWWHRLEITHPGRTRSTGPPRPSVAAQTEAQHGLSWLHKPLTSAWCPEAAKPEDIES